jgi:hypothetical protein
MRMLYSTTVCLYAGLPTLPVYPGVSRFLGYSQGLTGETVDLTVSNRTFIP